MCVRSKCRGCGGTNFYYCKSGDWSQLETGCYRPAYVPPDRRKKCPTCILIEAAIIKLRNMVVQQPWLETEGVSGADNRPAWETEGEEDGMTKETQEFCNEFWARAGLELNERLKAMNLDNLNGRENLMDGDGIDMATGSKEGAMSQRNESSGGSGQGTITSEGSVRDAGLGESDSEGKKTITVDCGSSI